MKLLSSALAALVCAAGLSAQSDIIVSISNGWTVTEGSDQTINNFSSNNGAGVAIGGSCSAEVGTNQNPSGFGTIASASINGTHFGGGTHTEGSSAVEGDIEFYSHPTGGSVFVTLNAQPVNASATLFGAGYSGAATATVAVTCPLFGWQRATAAASAVPPPAFPTMMTLPVSATATATNQTSFRVNMSAGSRAWGTLTSFGDVINLNASADASGTVTLF
ncbi:MAG: hypothetical protein AB8H80_07010 [Planctomycetota bacterium]